MTLRLDLLGGVRIATDAQGAGIFLPNRKARALLAYLAVPPGRRHSRDKLAALLWGDHPESQARASTHSSGTAATSCVKKFVVASISADPVAASATHIVTCPARWPGSALLLPRRLWAGVGSARLPLIFPHAIVPAANRAYPAAHVHPCWNTVLVRSTITG